MEFSVGKRSVWSRGTQAKAQFCMVCLNTSKDCKLFVGNTYNLDMEFEHLTGISLQGQTYFEPQFCAECAQRLRNCSNFRNKSLRAYHLLLGLVELDKQLTIQNIKTLSRSNNLTSSIAKKSFQPNYCDLNLNHEELLDQENLQQELAKNKQIKVQQDLPNNEPIKTQDEFPNNEPIKTKEEFPNNEPIKTQEDLLNNEPIKIEVKFFDVQLMLNPVPEVENEIVSKSFDDSYSDFDVNIDCIDDDIYSDVDTHCVKRIEEKVDKFTNDVMKDTDNDLVFLKDSDSDDNDRVCAIKTESKINLKKEVIRKPRTTRRKRQQVKKQVKEEYLEYFKVTELTHEEQLEDIQKRKEKANYKNGFYKCNKCFKGFLSDDAYKAHMDRHTDKYGKSECPICALCFRSDTVMRKHVARCHSTRYSCLRCPLVTNHDQAAINHANWHRGVTFTCPHCSVVRRSKTAYLSHLRITHPTDTVCTQCGYSFINERGLRTHINLKHHNGDVRNPDGPLCEKCNIRFASEEAYFQHLDVSPKHAADEIRKRNNPKKKRSKRNDGYSRKFNVTVTCEECGEQIKGIGMYQHHFQRSHPNKTRTQYPQYRQPRYLCDQCGKSFTTIHALRDHKYRHTGKKQFQCDMCKKLFYNKSAVVIHMKSHSEEQPVFACAVCDKKFINKANCKRHSWTHKEQKPYQCHACDKSFANATTLRAHVEHAHLKKPYPKKTRGPRQRASRARHAKEPVCGTIWPKVTRICNNMPRMH